MRENVQFSALDGTLLAAFSYTLDSGAGLFPAIVLSHGFGAVQEMALERYAHDRRLRRFRSRNQ